MTNNKEVMLLDTKKITKLFYGHREYQLTTQKKFQV